MAQENTTRRAGGASNERKKHPDWGASFIGGATRIRTGDKGFADPCLTTWPWRRIQNTVILYQAIGTLSSPFLYFMKKVLKNVLVRNIYRKTLETRKASLAIGERADRGSSSISACAEINGGCATSLWLLALVIWRENEKRAPGWV